MNDIPDDEAHDQPRRPFWNKRRMVRLLAIALPSCIAIALWAPRPGGNANATFSRIGAAVGSQPSGTNK